jgi:hypothetical protein
MISKLNGKYREFPYTSDSCTNIPPTPATIHIQHQSDTFLTTDEPALHTLLLKVQSLH